MLVDKEAPVPNSMAVPARASFVIKVHSKADLIEADKLAKKIGLPLMTLGEGTNVILQDYVKAVIVILDIRGIEESGEVIKIQAGEKWDDAVAFAVEKGLAGIEALSAIPGKAGAAPIQNIGAYGSEIADTLEYVEAYDRDKEKFVVLSKEDCKFGYRDSLFKKHRDKFIITSIDLRLSKSQPSIPQYKDVVNYFEAKKNNLPNLKEIREAIIEIRKNKLPDPSVVPNCGSFFKNPIIGKREVGKIKKTLPHCPIFPFKNKFKISAGFLIEQAGFKGQKVGKIEVYKNNALVLTNPNRAPFSDLMAAKEEIQTTVFQKFGIMLEPEVNILE